MNNKNTVLILATAAAVLAGTSPLAIAQTSSRGALEEVIVTAQKREESLQDAPISIKAFGSEQLEELGIAGIDDLVGKVPNLSLSTFPTDTTTLRVYIRGIGINDVQITQDAGVGIYLDGVYIARSTGLALDVADIASLEVLRGPQGTLFGRNAIGGAINIQTARPDSEALSFKQVITAGSRDLFTSRSTLNLPITDTLAAKAVYFNSEQDGYIKNQGVGGDFYDSDDEGFRIDFRWTPADNLTIDYAYDNSHSQIINPIPQAVEAPLESDPIFGASSLSALNSDTIFLTREERARSLPSTTRQIPSETDIEGHSLSLTWDIGNITFKSISSYRELSNDAFVDLSRSAGVLPNGEFFSLTSPALDINISGGNVFGISGPQSFPAAGVFLEQDQFTQELQLLGQFNDQTQYIFGLYYFTESAKETRPLSVITSFFNADLAALGVGRTDVLRDEKRSIENEAVAAYSQFDFTPKILDSRLTLTLGLRYTQDEREAENRILQDTFLSDGAGGLAETVAERGFASFAPAGILIVDGAASDSFSNFSYDFTASYAFSDSVNGYAKVATGYKSGGFNIREIVTEQFEEGFDEEEIITYEIGFKGEFLDRRVRLNTAIFYSDYDDIQLNLAIPPGQVVSEVTVPAGTFDVNANVTDTNVINAGTAELSGIEVDLTAVPIEGLILTASYAYLDTKFTKVVDSRPFADPDARFVFTNAPEHTYNLNSQYIFEPFSFGELSASVNYSFTDDRDANNDTRFTRNAAIPDFSLLDARITLSEISVGKKGHLSVAAWGKNLTDEEYLTDAVATIPGSGRSVFFGESRNYGLDIVYEFY